jgi:hypothetical protein
VKRVLVVAGALVTFALGSTVFASATQLAVSPASITPTMVATLTPDISLSLVNGGATAGQAERGDRLVLTFPKAIDASSLCSTWPASPTSTQTISANNALVVSIADGGEANDVLSLAAPGACGGTIELGTVDLGSTGFTSGGPLTFAGNGNGGRTTLAYDPTSLQLVLTFGTRGGAGAAATVSTSVTATYAPSGNLLYGDGSSVAPATGTTTGAAL